MVIKSGTNQFHGNVFEDFPQRQAERQQLGAQLARACPRSPLRWNQFGGTLGGRIMKDKLFFFADYQGLRQARPTSLTSTTVMPTAWRNGDFSSLLDPDADRRQGDPALQSLRSDATGLARRFRTT